MTATQWSLLALVVLGLAEIATPDSVIFLPFVGLVPLISAFDGPARNTVMFAVAGVLIAVMSGFVNGLAFTARHVLGIVAAVAIGLVAWRLAVFRNRRERALRDTRPHVERSLRLASAMAAGDIGEWWYDAESRVTRGDPAAHRLLGLSGESDVISFPDVLDATDARDRARVEDLIRSSSSVASGFRSDHRVRRPDGDLHWVELVGEPVTEDEAVVGFAGLVQSADERHREVEERDRLLEVEAAARHRVEFLDRLQSVFIRSVDAREILDHLCAVIIPELADLAVVVFTVDGGGHRPLVVARHRDPHQDTLLGRRSAVGEVTVSTNLADLVAVPPVVDAAGRPLVRVRSDASWSSDTFVRWAERFDVTSVVSVPIVGPLGELGVLHVARCGGRPSPSPLEVGLVEEIAARAGGALNVAVLNARLVASRAHLQALQTVTGELAAAATFGDVSRAVLGEGRNAMRAQGAAIFVVERSHRLRLAAADGVADAAGLQELAECALREGRAVDGPGGGDDQVAVAVPLVGRDGPVGVLEFVVASGRVFTTDDMMMLDSLASRAAAALARSATYDRDHDVALVLQRRLLPDVSHVPDWLRVAAHYEPATGGPIGGDWFQMVDLGGGRVAAVVGDAVGHGLVAAAAMGQLRAAVTTALAATRDPSIALAIVDRFAGLSADTVGATLVVAVIDENGSVLHSSAGHPPPLLVPAAGAVRVWSGGRRPLLGYGRSAAPSSAFERIAPSDTLVLFSDGLIERRGRSFDAGLDELVRIVGDLRRLDVEVIAHEVIERMHVRTDAEDDVAVMVVRRVLPSAGGSAEGRHTGDGAADGGSTA